MMVVEPIRPENADDPERFMWDVNDIAVTKPANPDSAELRVDPKTP